MNDVRASLVLHCSSTSVYYCQHKPKNRKQDRFETRLDNITSGCTSERERHTHIERYIIIWRAVALVRPYFDKRGGAEDWPDCRISHTNHLVYC